MLNENFVSSVVRELRFFKISFSFWLIHCFISFYHLERNLEMPLDSYFALKMTMFWLILRNWLDLIEIVEIVEIVDTKISRGVSSLKNIAK